MDGSADRVRVSHYALFFTALALTPAVAVAQTPPEASRAEAQLHFDRGVALAYSARWQDAIHELEIARNLRATSSVHFNLAMAYRAVGRQHDAINEFQAYISSASPTADRDRTTRAHELINELQHSQGSLRLLVSPSTASVTLDGEPFVLSAHATQIDPGLHVVVVSAPGHHEVTRRVTVVSGGTIEREIRLVALEGTGRLQVDASVASALIRIDGLAVSNRSADEYVSAGHHVVDVVAGGFAPFRRELDVPSAGVVRIDATLIARPTILTSPWLWGGVALVAGGLIAGGIVLFSHTDPAFDAGYGHVTGAITVMPAAH